MIECDAFRMPPRPSGGQPSNREPGLVLATIVVAPSLLVGEYNNMKKAIVSIAFGLTASLLATGASAQATLNSVKQKGFLTCGSNTGLAGLRRA